MGLKGVVINMIYLFNQQMLQVWIMKDTMKPNQKVNKHMIDGSRCHGFNVDTIINYDMFKKSWLQL
jgi:hypothetical protein